MQIKFSKPNIKELRKKGYKCVDMHFHTSHSDGAAKVDEVLKIIRELDIGISITDHTEISGAVEAFEKKKPDDFLIPGVELRSKEDVDILLYFYDIKELKDFFEKEIVPLRKKVLKMYYKLDLTLQQIYDISKKYNCISCVAHPFGYSMRGGSKKTFETHKNILKKYDFVEAINGGTSKKNNQKAIELIKKNKKGFTGGSDGHSIYDFAKVITYTKAKTVEQFLNNIKNKKNYVVGIENKYGKSSTYVNYIKNKVKNILK